LILCIPPHDKRILTCLYILYIIYERRNTGIFIENNNVEENFLDFIRNSEVEFLSNGRYGLTFKALLRPGAESKYKSIDNSAFGSPVNCLIIKLSVLKYNLDDDDMDEVPIDPIEEEDFRREVNIQTDVFLKTMNYLQPLCPAIVYSNIHDNTDQDSTNVLSILANQMNHENKFYSIITSLKIVVQQFSIIGMEMLNNYKTLRELRNETNDDVYERYRLMSAFILIDLAIKTGYSHSDFHASNIMINPDDTTYFKGLNGNHCENNQF